MDVKQQKVYLETTVFNYYFDTDRDAHAATVKFFDEIRHGKYEAYTSAYVLAELEKASEPKRSNMINLIASLGIELLEPEIQAENLADMYVKEGVIPRRFRLDGVHIALASIKELDYIISLNFQHINKQKTKTYTALINKLHGYNKEIIICSPMEVIEDE